MRKKDDEGRRMGEKKEEGKRRRREGTRGREKERRGTFSDTLYTEMPPLVLIILINSTFFFKGMN